VIAEDEDLMMLPSWIGAKQREQKFREQKFRELYIADRPVDFSKITEFRGDAFPESGPAPWLDRPNALIEVERLHRTGKLTDNQAEICAKWIFDGYVIIPGLIDHDVLDRVWQAYEQAVKDGTVRVAPESLGPDDVYPGRHLDTHLVLPIIRELQLHTKVLEITDLLFGRKTLPFQTIMGHKGSSQNPHSDSIHMTTYPFMYLIANWIAFEDIHPDSGPLKVYPRSHKLVPQILSGELGISPLEYKTKGPSVYSERYEPTIRRYIEAMTLEPQLFMAKAGDVLFWHANLLHGGAQRKNLQLSRKALVCHYFAEGVVTYHDLSGNPSRLHRSRMYEAPVPDHAWIQSEYSPDRTFGLSRADTKLFGLPKIAVRPAGSET
jgi:hypothetical protein